MVVDQPTRHTGLPAYLVDGKCAHAAHAEAAYTGLDQLGAPLLSRFSMICDLFHGHAFNPDYGQSEENSIAPA